MTRKMIITCECCGLNTDPTKAREVRVAVAFPIGAVRSDSPDSVSFDFCEDCITKVAGYGVDDGRCFTSIVHQAQQAGLAMFKAEVKKFDEGKVEPGESAWACACGQKNSGYASVCGRCGRTKKGGGT